MNNDFNEKIDENDKNQIIDDFNEKIDENDKNQIINNLKKTRKIEPLDKIYDDFSRKKITYETYNSYKEKFNILDTTVYDEIQIKKYLEIEMYFHKLEIDSKMKNLSESINTFNDNAEDKISDLHNDTVNVKTEILTMMGLFFAIFTFIQVNFTFTQKFLENYNGYRLILYIVLINIVLLIILSFIMEMIGALVYGKNKARIQNGTNYLKFFKESELKIKRSFIYSILMLLMIGGFAFYNEKGKETEKYEKIEKKLNDYKIHNNEIEKVISEKINKFLNNNEKKYNKKDIEILKNEIMLQLYEKKLTEEK